MPSTTEYGRVLPIGPDFVSSLPTTAIDDEAALRGMILVPCASVDQRNLFFPNPGINDRPKVSIGALAERHEWDGKQWLIYDERPKTYPSYWYSGSSLQVLSVGAISDPDGAMFTTTVKRDGWFMDWRIILRRGPNTNVGSGYYSYFLPYPTDNWLTASGKASLRIGSREIEAGVVFRDANRPVIILNEGRMGTDSFSYSTGDKWSLSGRTMIGGLVA